MSKSNTWENDLLVHLFNNTALTNYGDATGLAASGAAGSLFVSLHTADPGEAGSQTTSESAYTNYVRVAVARSGAGWTVSATAPTQVVNTSAVVFPACGVTGSTVTHFGVGTLTSGAGKLLYSGELGSNQGVGTAKASTDIITIPGHTFAVNDNIVLHTVGSNTFPTGATDGTIYFIKTVSSNDVTISTTQGGATLDITGDGVCWTYKDVALIINNGITPQLNASAIVITED